MLYNDDARKILSTLQSESIDLIVTDPPYRVTSHGASQMGGMFRDELTKKGRIFRHNDIKVSEYASEFYRVLKEGTHLYVMTNHVNLIEMLNEFTTVGFHFIKSLIWDKTNKITGRYYMSQYEYILFFRKGRERPINNQSTADILRISNKKSKYNGENAHPTEKPIELMRILVENSSKEGDLVLDPFAGIGATGVACAETNRSFIGVEIDEEYFSIAKKRIEDAENGMMGLDFSGIG